MVGTPDLLELELWDLSTLFIILGIFTYFDPVVTHKITEQLGKS
jgi:hypothetical protein